MNTCQHCVHGQKIEGRIVCKRYPPQSSLVPAQGLAGPTMQLVSHWPQVQPVDGCGEFERDPGVSFVTKN